MVTLNPYRTVPMKTANELQHQIRCAACVYEASVPSA